MPKTTRQAIKRNHKKVTGKAMTFKDKTAVGKKVRKQRKARGSNPNTGK